MKYINNGNLLNIIKDSDINLSESFENRNLADVLSEYKKDLNTLKSNVKWLAKYGGVGGSGGGSGGSGSDVKLKYKVDILYVNDLGTLNTALLVFKSTNNNIIVKSASLATVVITLLRAAPGILYYATITYGSKTETLLINLSTFLASKVISCTGNLKLTVTVYATPEDRPETSVLIYTTVKKAELGVKLPSGTSISSGNTVLQEFVSNPETKLIGTLTNYLPEQFDGIITNLKVNNTEVDIDYDESMGISGEYVLKFEIPVKSIFNDFGIYELIMTYTYNNLTETVKSIYVYKDDDVFVYCYGDTNTVYTQVQTNPNTSNFNLETVKFRIYPKTGATSNTEYTVTYNIDYEDKPNKTISEELYKESNKDWEIKFQNVYTKDDFASNSLYKQVTITFTIGSKQFVYYVYITKVAEFEYIFKHTYKDLGSSNDIEEFFYNARHTCTATFDEPFDTRDTTFPFLNGQFIKLNRDSEHKINSLATKTSLHYYVTSVYGSMDGTAISGGLITNYKSQEGGEDPDVLLSFGLKYYEDNKDLPILTIKVSENHSIILYSDKISYTGNKTYTRWQIPNDSNYHLILLYYKPRYTIEGHRNITLAPDNTSSFIFCIDGIFETSPILIDATSSLVAFSKDVSSITYHPGNWDFNFIGVASFNAKPSSFIWLDYKDNFSTYPQILRYALDFDPIIPANYYLAYYKFTNDVELPYTFDKSIYSSLYSTGDVDNCFGINFYKDLNKFIPSDIVTIGSLTNLPIYIIEPEPSKAVEHEKSINNFLHKTYAGGYNENSTELPNVECLFKRVIINGTQVTEQSMVNDTNYRFSVTYLGSSTLKYGVKNFEISAVPFKDDNDVNHTVVWTPDQSKFLPEQSFTLKADVVDSSHSNNVVIGKFVNDYMKDSSFKNEDDDLNIKTCLEGFPILLFMKDIIPSSGDLVTTSSNTIFLGIYSFNLGRNSVYNLGYKRLNVDECDDISVEGTSSKAYLLKNDDAIIYPYNYRVAEVLGNSLALFDYSLYDLLMLLHKMLGDFYNKDSAGENSLFSGDFLKPFIGLNKLIYKSLIGDLECNYEPYEFSDTNTLQGYYSPKNNNGLFNVLLLNFNYSGEDRVAVLDDYYYKDSSGNPIKIENGLIITDRAVSQLKPYLTYAPNNNLTVISNPMYQFHLVCDVYGTPFKDSYYYVEKLNSINDFNSSADDYFDYDTMLRYYMVCMIFAMVDSVQKNLTIRCKNYTAGASNPWLLGFYDMDTSFGVNNFGNPVDFKAFSDYILDDGKIISDYFEEDSTSSEGSGFDAPSTFLILAAKYLNILTNENDTSVPLGERHYVNTDSSEKLKTPFNYWQSLRQEGGELADVDGFFSKYVDNHFSDVNPLIWNLNYLYKYFSATGTSTGDTDTELSKFNGTRKFSRKSWLKLRFEIIDVLFGIRNNHSIGNSNTLYICKLKANTPTSDLLTFNGFVDGVPIAKTMFPEFSKGVTVDKIRVSLTTYPKAPVVLQTSTNDYKLYLANNLGKIENIEATIPSNTDVGFYGTSTIKLINECGLFMVDTVDLNYIVNNIILTINIDKGLKNGALSISLDLSQIPSVKTINVNTNGTATNFYSCKDFLVFANSDAYLEKVEVAYAKVSGTISISSNRGILEIGTLDLSNCECTKLKLTNVRINTLVLDNCLVSEYELVGYFPDLNLTDGTTTKFTLKALGGDISTTIAMSALVELSILGSIKKFIHDAASSSCNVIHINELTPETVTLQLNRFLNYSSNIDINLSTSVKTLKLKCYNNKCTGYNIIQDSGLTSVELLENAFTNNRQITYINLVQGGTVSPLITKVLLLASGLNTFYNCDNLPSEYCIPTTLGLLKLTNTNGAYSHMYLNNLHINIDDVINFFNNVQCDVDNLNFTGIFGLCSGIEFSPILNTGSIYKQPQKYGEFLSALSSFVLGKNVNFKYAFALTGFNYLDSSLVEHFKSNQIFDSISVTVLPDICPLGKNTTTDPYIYVTSDFLTKNNSILRIHLGERYSMNDTVYAETLVKVMEVNDGVLTIQASVNLHDLLNSGSLLHIGCLNMYSGDDVEVDCSGGFPNTVKGVDVFGNKINSFHFKNLDKLFYNVSDCSVLIDRFFGSSNTDTSPAAEAYKVNLFDLFWKQLDDKTMPRIKFKLHSVNNLDYSNKTSLLTSFVIRGNSALDNSLNFFKICTADLFKKIMLYLIDEQLEYLRTGTAPSNCMLYNQIPGLFSYCTITGVSDFEKLIEADDNKSYFSLRYIRNENTGELREVNFIGLERTFLNCALKAADSTSIPFDVSKMWELVSIDGGTYKTKVVNLANTFQGTYLVKIENPLNIRWVRSMKRCFYNCTYQNSSSGEVLNASPSGLTLAINWAWKKNFPILPAKFFNDFYLCDVTEAFASNLKLATNIQGHLPENSDEFWWNAEDVNISTSNNLFTYALIHPIHKTEINDEEEEFDVYYLYPKTYTDNFSSLDNVYKHITLPYTSSSDSALYLFEDSETLLNLKGGLPVLPDNLTSTFYDLYISDEPWNVLINKEGKFMNNSSLMGYNDYVKILPMSLFLVLRHLEFNTYNMNKGPIVSNDNNGYSVSINDYPKDRPTPGNIIINNLYTKLINNLLE